MELNRRRQAKQEELAMKRAVYPFVALMLLALIGAQGLVMAQTVDAKASAADTLVAIIRDGTEQGGPCLITTTIHPDTPDAKTTQNPCPVGAILYVDRVPQSVALALREPYAVIPVKATTEAIATFDSQVMQLYANKRAKLAAGQQMARISPTSCVTGPKVVTGTKWIVLSNGNEVPVSARVAYDVPNCSQVYLDTSWESVISGYSAYDVDDSFNAYAAGNFDICQPLSSPNVHFINETHTIGYYFIFGWEEPLWGIHRCDRQDYQFNIGKLS
jgi:hypothetical protein